MDRFLQFQQRLENLVCEFNDLPTSQIAEHLEFYSKHYKKRKDL